METKYVPKMTEITAWNMAGEMLSNFMKKKGLYKLIQKTKIDATMFEQWEQSIQSVDKVYFDFYEKIKIWEYEKKIFKEMGYLTPLTDDMLTQIGYQPSNYSKNENKNENKEEKRKDEFNEMIIKICDKYDKEIDESINEKKICYPKMIEYAETCQWIVKNAKIQSDFDDRPYKHLLIDELVKFVNRLRNILSGFSALIF